MIHQQSEEESPAPARADRSRVLRRLVTMDREATLGAILASVAHSINTPLMEVYGLVAEGRDRTKQLQRSARASVEEGEVEELIGQMGAVTQLFDQVRADLIEVATTTRTVGVFARPKGGARRTEQPTELLQASIDLMENAIRHRARFASELCELPPLRGSEEDLGHLFIAALTASLHAVPEVGAANHTVTLRTRAEGDSVVIEVDDTGGERRLPADDEQSLRVMLDGTDRAGVALAVCRTLVGDLGGALTLTRLPRGQRLRIQLRVSGGGRSSQEPPVVAEPAVTPPRGRVLVIDDEPMLLRLVCEILRLDHEVEGTVDPHDALARVEAGERYDVILCDLMMPTMGGVDLYQAIQRIAPHVASRMVFLTAGAFSDRARAFVERGAVPCLEKPMEPAALRAAVREYVVAER